MTRVIQYIKNKDITLTIEPAGGWWTAHKLNIQTWIVIWAYTWELEKEVHINCHANILKTKSSAEAEQNNWSDTMNQAFPGHPRSAHTETIIYQDNKSTIQFSEDRRLSSSKRTRHLDIRFFLRWQKQKRKSESILTTWKTSLPILKKVQHSEKYRL